MTHTALMFLNCSLLIYEILFQYGKERQKIKVPQIQCLNTLTTLGLSPRPCIGFYGLLLGLGK